LVRFLVFVFCSFFSLFRASLSLSRPTTATPPKTHPKNAQKTPKKHPQLKNKQNTTKTTQTKQRQTDPLDVTKTWPEDLFPLQPVGRMVLNRNPDNFFAENEQLAFCPSLVVPGISYSDDKLLQTRIFSYADTQRHRLGPNYLQLPVNAPRNAHKNGHHDGQGQFMLRTSEINYFPSRLDPARHASLPGNQAMATRPLNNGQAVSRARAVIAKENNFSQPGARFRSFDSARQERFVSRLADLLGDARCTREIRRIWIGYLAQADSSLGSRVAAKLQQAHGGAAL
jgi:catalase